MPRRKNWKWCEKNKEDRRKKQKTDDGRADRETSRVESGDGGGSDSADRYEMSSRKGGRQPTQSGGRQSIQSGGR